MVRRERVSGSPCACCSWRRRRSGLPRAHLKVPAILLLLLLLLPLLLVVLLVLMLVLVSVVEEKRGREGRRGVSCWRASMARCLGRVRATS